MCRVERKFQRSEELACLNQSRNFGGMIELAKDARVVAKAKKQKSEQKIKRPGKSACVRCDGRGRVCNVCGESEGGRRCEGELVLTECPDCCGLSLMAP
jgi:hypothetical protein